MTYLADPALGGLARREAQRLSVLAGLRILDTPPEAEFDIIAACAQRLLGCPIALISLVDDHRQWFKAKCGLEAEGTPREQAFCAHAIQGEGPFIINDALLDARFADNPLVTGAPFIRFYAGMPIRVRAVSGNGRYAIGTVCVIDHHPHELTAQDVGVLRDLGQLVESLLDARAKAFEAVTVAEERKSIL